MPWKRIWIHGQWGEESEWKIGDQLGESQVNLDHVLTLRIIVLPPTIVNNYSKVIKALAVE